MKNETDKQALTQLTKESPKARKERVSSGVQLRPVAFADKKRRETARKKSTRQLLEENKS